MNTESKIEKMLTVAGGKEWKKENRYRIYFNSLADRLGIRTEYYGTGNIQSVRIDGIGFISNTKGGKLLRELKDAKFWYDVVTDEFHHRAESREMLDRFFGDHWPDKIFDSIKAQISE